MSELIQLENKFYISVNSTYADDRVKVLNHVNTFGIFDRWGDIKQIGEEVQGIYHNGTRYISHFELRLNDQRPLLLSSSVKEENEILSVDLTNPLLMAGDKSIPKDILYIGRSKFIRNGSCMEQIRINNYGCEVYEFELSISFDADFKDIFEVRGITRGRRGEITEIKHLPEGEIRIYYMGLDHVERITCIHFLTKPNDWKGHSKAIYRINLPPHEERYIEYSLHFVENETAGDGKMIVSDSFNEGLIKLQDELKKDAGIIATIGTSNEQFNQWIDRSRNDLLTLLAYTEYGRYPFAGVPWYNTAFGRDGIITALETLWAAPDIARAVLLYLSRTQATELDPYRDAEPGKIMHEIRGGEMAALNEIPFKRYYGSVDSTPLFVMLAGAYFGRTADLEFMQTLWPHIEAAMRWINHYGDPDGDGFVEYQHKSINGLTNQGWKDSHDSIMHTDGTFAPSPIALCEVQGYVYDAKKQAAKIAAALGYTDNSLKWESEAAQLKRNFNEQFWDEELSCYVLALDGRKKSCRVVTSNAGHCLFTSIADDEKAKKLAKRLLQPDMFTGWGIRTLGMWEKRYNPMSYHNGSVWPHDVAIIGRGFSKYGLIPETLQITSALFDASLFIELQRLPELFCGFDRRRGEGPTNYPVACSPQAWSVGAVFMLLEACLHMDIYAAQKKVYFYNPVIPEGIDEVTISGLKLGEEYANFKLFSKNSTIGIKVMDCPPGWQILIIAEHEPEFP